MEIVEYKEQVAAQIKVIDAGLLKQRIGAWREFARGSTSKPKKLYDWVKRTSLKVGNAGLHWDQPEPPGGTEERVPKACLEWTQFWEGGDKIEKAAGRVLKPVSAVRVEKVTEEQWANAILNHDMRESGKDLA
jgi:hypothetical protein